MKAQRMEGLDDILHDFKTRLLPQPVLQKGFQSLLAKECSLEDESQDNKIICPDTFRRDKPHAGNGNEIIHVGKERL
jgi:hypothetical protein